MTFLSPSSFRHRKQSLHSSPSVSTDALVQEGMSFLRHLKTYRQNLLDLVSNTDGQIQSLQPKLRRLIFDRGMASLPAELLARILELSLENGSEEDKLVPSKLARIETLTFSHVCRRFRGIAVSLPKVWNTVSNRMRLEAVQTCLSRSADSNLRVGLELAKASATSCSDFLAVVAPESHRWERFDVKLDLSRVTQEDFSDMRAALASCGVLKVPSLRNLTIVANEPPLATLSALDAAAIQFYNSCNLPSLERLSALNFIPRLPLGGACLKSCTIELYHRDNLPWDIALVSQFLVDCPELEDLILHLRSEDLLTLEPISEMHLPRLKSFDFCAPVHQGTTPIHRFMRKLIIPSVSSMTIEFDLYDRDLEDDWIRHFFPGSNQYDHLTNLSIQLCWMFYLADDAIERILTRFPSVRNLSIEAPNYQGPDANAKGGLPALKTLRLKNCNSFDSFELRNLLARLRAVPGGDEFEKLVVEGCWDIEEDDCASLLPKDKYSWRP